MQVKVPKIGPMNGNEYNVYNVMPVIDVKTTMTSTQIFRRGLLFALGRSALRPRTSRRGLLLALGRSALRPRTSRRGLRNAILSRIS